jgi:hypothetical protein
MKRLPQRPTLLAASPWPVVVALIAGTLALPGCKGCQKEPVVAPAAPAPGDLPAAATATDAPAAATPADVTAVAAPEDATPVQPERYSIAPTLVGNTPPVAGKAAKFKVLLIDGKGQAVTERDPVMGQELIIVVARPGHEWMQILGVPKLSDPTAHSHAFEFVPPSVGNYVVGFLFKPKGRPLAMEQMTISATGEAKIMPLPPSSDLKFDGQGGLEVALRTNPDPVLARKQTSLATLWSKNGQPLALQPAPAPPGTAGGVETVVYYVAVGDSEPRLELFAALASPTAAGDSAAPMGGDVGTLGSFTFQLPGNYYLSAIGLPRGNNQLVTANFSLAVQEAMGAAPQAQPAAPESDPAAAPAP